MTETRDISELIRQRPLILDGAMGTMIQKYNLKEKDYLAERFADFSDSQTGNNDLLVITQPAIIEQIHYDFLKAGADIVETCTFGANAVSQSDYAMESMVAEINRAAVKLAAKAVERIESEEPGRVCFVAGSMGPTNKTASISPDVNDPGFRAIDFDELCRIYREQAEALITEGVDLLLVETVFDTLNAKAALYAIQECFDSIGRKVPIMVSATVADKSGRTLSGQTVLSFYHSVKHADLFSVGINCSLGADEMFPYLETLNETAGCCVSVYANAGLPNAFGGYDDSPESMAAVYRQFAEAGLCNIYGGCCGTTPAHIRAIADAVEGSPVRVPPVVESRPVFTGLEPLFVRTKASSAECYSPGNAGDCVTAESGRAEDAESGGNFIMIGERSNVTGSRKFARLIREEKFEEAIQIARKQVEDGANLIDINMDEAMIDSKAMMVRFLNLLAAEPDVARVPVVIDSSDWDVIEAGLKTVQGRSVVNSISLKEGESQFREHALKVRRLGAVPIVMAFDESGQADTTERRVEICRRAFKILTEDVGFKPCEIIFDLNIFPVGTGMEEHRRNAVSFIEAMRLIKEEMPGVIISGGVSNLSFSFRGNNRVREAMHAVFLHHAIDAGMDMGIVNAGMLEIYDEIDRELLEYVEDVVLDRRDDATERLLDYAQNIKKSAGDIADKGLPEWRKLSLEGRLSHALVKGIPDYIKEDLAEAVEKYDSALQIIEGPLMQGMGHVGELFGAGRMFLPQVVKSARSMKKAVEILEPLLDADADGSLRKSGKIIFATVRGDVHDIGKNIVSIVLQCNNFEVVDLGVMVSKEDILKAAVEKNADIIAVSGLITPSLKEMEYIAEEMQGRGMKMPLIVGGATTSPVHTAVKLAPLYDGIVAYSRDASISVPLVQALISNDRQFIANLKREQELTRSRFYAAKAAVKLIPYRKAQENRPELDFSLKTEPQETGIFVESVPIEELVPYIDWTFFFFGWDIRKKYPDVLDDPEYGERTRELLSAARELLGELAASREIRPETVYAVVPAVSDGNDIQVQNRRFHFLRQQQPGSSLCVSDFVDTDNDYVGLFAVTAGRGFADVAAACREENDDFKAMMILSLANRIAEALAEYTHHRIREKWGIDVENKPEKMLVGEYRGIRLAVGYPSWPDHSELAALFDILDVQQRIGVSYTETYMMQPESSSCGMVLTHPDARFFDVGKITEEQLEDYAKRKGADIKDMKTRLGHNLVGL
ncbi:MAG: methionine synthase [Kiritimatiellia bacterium]